MSLHRYQEDIVGRLSVRFETHRSGVLQLGTGGGKTHTAAEIIRRSVALGNRVLFGAHLDTLIDDTHDRLVAHGVPCGIVQAGKVSSPLFPVQVASTATLHMRGERPPAELIILDECHRAMAASVRAILDSYGPETSILGLTATPQRGDGRPLGDVFEFLECGPTNRELTRAGHLVPCDVIHPPDFTEHGLAAHPVDAYAKHTPDTRGICFATNVAHANKLALEFEAAGVPSAVIVGDTPRSDRRRIRTMLEEGSVRMVVGVAVFLEGWDCPPIETVILARAFTVTGAFLQAIGRGLRPSPATGKTKCTVLDLRSSYALHGLPDEDFLWSLEGKAVRRADITTALMKCKECLAVFKPAVRCPRCAAITAGTPKIPRILNRAEKLARSAHLAQWERDERYVRALEHRARVRIGMPSTRAMEWALKKFVQRFGREPERAS